MGSAPGDAVRKERAWWLRADGLPPSAERRRQELLTRPFTAERARRNIALLTILISGQVAIFLGWTVFVWSRHGRSAVVSWLIFGLFTTFNLVIFLRHRKDFRNRVNA